METQPRPHYFCTMSSVLGPRYSNMDPEVCGMHPPFGEFGAARSLKGKGHLGGADFVLHVGMGPWGRGGSATVLTAAG